MVSAAIVVGVAGAAALLAFNNMVVRHGSGVSKLASVSTTSETAPVAYNAGPNGTTATSGASGGSGTNGQSSAIAVANSVDSMISGLLPGIVAVDVTGPTRNEQGTGLVVRQDGMILTAGSLVSDATTITVTSSDGQEWNANLVGTDPATGAAVISVPATGLVVLPVASADDIQAGELSLVVCANSRSGGPYQTSIGRFLGVNQQVELDGGALLMDAIVTDSTPPNPTGGIIFDDRGRVVGIVQSVLSGGGTTKGIATPISTVQDAANSLIAGQKVVHAWLGVAGMTGRGGAVVKLVAPSSPAATAGIHPGDIVTGLDNRPIASMAALSAEVESLQPGETVLLRLLRGASSVDVAATLDGQPVAGP